MTVNSFDGKSQTIAEYMKREVLPHLTDAWVDETKTKTGYEINFTKYFYEFKLLQRLEDIRKDILDLETETMDIIRQTVLS